MPFLLTFVVPRPSRFEDAKPGEEGGITHA